MFKIDKNWLFLFFFFSFHGFDYSQNGHQSAGNLKVCISFSLSFLIQLSVYAILKVIIIYACDEKSMHVLEVLFFCLCSPCVSWWFDTFSYIQLYLLHENIYETLIMRWFIIHHSWGKSCYKGPTAFLYESHTILILFYFCTMSLFWCHSFRWQRYTTSPRTIWWLKIYSSWTVNQRSLSGLANRLIPKIECML